MNMVGVGMGDATRARDHYYRGGWRGMGHARRFGAVWGGWRVMGSSQESVVPVAF